MATSSAPDHAVAAVPQRQALEKFQTYLMDAYVKRMKVTRAGIDITVIFQIMQAIMAIFSNCPMKPSAAVVKEDAAKMGILKRIWLNRQMAGQLREAGVRGITANEAVDICCEAGKLATADEVQAVVDTNVDENPWE